MAVAKRTSSGSWKMQLVPALIAIFSSNFRIDICVVMQMIYVIVVSFISVTMAENVSSEFDSDFGSRNPDTATTEAFSNMDLRPEEDLYAESVSSENSAEEAFLDNFACYSCAGKPTYDQAAQVANGWAAAELPGIIAGSWILNMTYPSVWWLIAQNVTTFGTWHVSYKVVLPTKLLWCLNYFWWSWRDIWSQLTFVITAITIKINFKTILCMLYVTRISNSYLILILDPCTNV